jgi:cardiolipin synthase C
MHIGKEQSMRHVFLIGLITGALVLSSCLPTRKRQIQGNDPVATPEGLSEQRLSSNDPAFSPYVYEDTEVAFIAPKDQLFTSRMYLLDNAREQVRIQKLLLRGDESGYLLYEKLKSLKERGLKVEVIVDPLGNFALNDQRLFALMQRAGIVVYGFNSMFGNWLEKIRRYDHLGIFFSKENYRYHEKVMMIDSHLPDGMAIIGGANIGNEYFAVSPGEPKNNWTDIDVMLKGPIVQKIDALFDDNIRILKVKEGEGTSWDQILNAISRPERMIADMRTEYLDIYKSFEPYQPTFLPSKSLFLYSRPKIGEDNIHPKLISTIDNAKSEILIGNAYFVPEDDMIAAFKAAALRGVKITILSNSVETNDLPATSTMSRILYKQILENSPNIRVYEWGGDKVLGNGEGTMHAKMMLVDQQLAIIGSYNLDPRSHWLNSESVAVIDSAALTKRYRDLYLSWLRADMVTEIDYQKTLEFADPKDLLGYFRKLVAQLFRDQL